MCNQFIETSKHKDRPRQDTAEAGGDKLISMRTDLEVLISFDHIITIGTRDSECVIVSV